MKFSLEGLNNKAEQERINELEDKTTEIRGKNKMKKKRTKPKGPVETANEVD